MRTISREFAFKVIFCNLFSNETREEVEPVLFSNEKVDDSTKSFYNDILNAYFEHKEEIKSDVDVLIEKYEQNRVYKIDLALIYLAITEIKYLNTPIPVAINEILELSKKYSEEKSPSFINGVLKKIKG